MATGSMPQASASRARAVRRARSSLPKLRVRARWRGAGSIALQRISWAGERQRCRWRRDGGSWLRRSACGWRRATRKTEDGGAAGGRCRRRQLRQQPAAFADCHSCFPPVPAVGRQGDEDLPLGMAGDIGEREHALSLGGAALAAGQQAAEAAIGGAVGRQCDEARGVGEIEAGADDELETDLLGGEMGAGGAGEGIAVGDGDGGKAESLGGRHQFLGVGTAVEEGEVGCHLQFRISRGVVGGGREGGAHATVASAEEAVQEPRRYRLPRRRRGRRGRSSSGHRCRPRR